MDLLLLEIAGFLNLIAQGIHAPNEAEQAMELVEKIGQRLASPPHDGSETLGDICPRCAAQPPRLIDEGTRVFCSTCGYEALVR